MHFPSWLMGPLVNLILPTVTTAVASYVYQQAKKGLSWLDNQSPKVHEYVFGAWAILQPVIAPTLAQYVPGLTDPHQLTEPMVQSLVALLAGKLVHSALSKPSGGTT